MSQLAPARTLPRTSGRRSATAAPRQLRVVAPPEIRGNGAFLALCVALLLGGFVAVLMLNTAMAKGSYTIRDLQHRSDELTDTQDSLRHDIDALSGPGPLAKRARALGMVPAASPAFLRLSDGKVLGVAKKAKHDSTFSVVTEPAAPRRSTPVPTASTPTTGATTTTGSASTSVSPTPAASAPAATTQPTARPSTPAGAAPATTGPAAPSPGVTATTTPTPAR